MATRIARELATLQQTPVDGVTAGPIGDDLFKWQAKITGAAGTPYESGVFNVEIIFPFDYPLKPPQCKFLTPIYHPNISPQGAICLDVLKKSWTPMENISKVLASLYFLLSTPDPDDSLSADIGAQYKTDRDAFNRTALEWTRQHAMPK